MKTYYKSSGYVYGHYWGGGAGAYPAKKLENNSLKKLLKEIKQRMKDGSLDSGMGYESLIGALLEIETITTIEKDEKDFTHSEFDSHIVGKLTEQQINFLEECNMYS